MKKRQRNKAAPLAGLGKIDHRQMRHPGGRHICHEVHVRQLGTLWLARGPRGVEDRARIVGGGGVGLKLVRLILDEFVERSKLLQIVGERRRTQLDHNEVLAGRHLVKGLFGGRGHWHLRRALKHKHRLGVRVLQVIGDLALFEKHVQRHNGSPGLHNAVVNNRKVGQVRAHQSDLIAMSDAHPHEGICQLIRAPVELAKGHADLVPYDRFVIRC